MRSGSAFPSQIFLQEKSNINSTFIILYKTFIKDRKIRRNCNLLIKVKFRKFEQSSALINPEKDIVINSKPNADILKKHENRFFSIKLRIFDIWALNFPHVY